MANQNGRTERDDARNFSNQNLQSFQSDSDNTEHGYQDPRDQRDRQNGRDDFRGGDFAERNFQSTDRNSSDRWSPRGVRGLSQAGDEFAETDRNMNGDRDRFGRNDQENSGSTAYGYDDGNRQQMNYRGGQSGAQSGNRMGNRMDSDNNRGGSASRGGNEGHWGDFDRGGQYARGYGISQNDRNYDTQAPQYGAQDPRSANAGMQGNRSQVYGAQGNINSSQGYGSQGNSGSQGQGSSSYGTRNSGEQTWSAQRGQHAGKGPQGFTRSDDRIKEMVHEALTDHEHLDATHITVDVKSGEVTLTGTVDDRQAKRLAEDVVENVTGVKDVQNQIRVKADSSKQSASNKSGQDGSSTNTSHVEIPNDSGKTKSARPS